MQHRITEKKSLLDEKGILTECGYAHSLVLDYNRSAIKAASHRIKEWDYYLITNGRYAVALTIADNSYMGLDSISFLDLDEKKPWEHTKSPMQAFPFGRKNLPSTSVSGDVHSGNKHFDICFRNDGETRILTFYMDNFMDGKMITGEFRLDCPPDDTMVIATPYKEDKKSFYYNQKINCMPARGMVTLGDETYSFSADDSFATLDWGRGVWLRKGMWLWGTCSGLHAGERFGFNIGYGFGDTSAASENMIFYRGKAHKLEEVKIFIPTLPDGTDAFMSDWRITSSDKRFEMDFHPILDRKSKTDIGIICSDQHQVFGKIQGMAILDDGTVLEIKDALCAIEKIRNKW